MTKNNNFWIEIKEKIETQFEQQDYAIIEKETPSFLIPPKDFFQNSKKAGTGNGSAYKETSVRSDRILWIDEEKNFEIKNFFNNGIKELSNILRFPISEFEAHWAFYPEETGFYGKHVDAFKQNNKRIVSMVTYFNDEWKCEDGGALRLYNNDNKGYKDIMPKKNTWVFFSSEKVEHEVLKTLKPRYSMAAWFKKA